MSPGILLLFLLLSMAHTGDRYSMHPVLGCRHCRSQIPAYFVAGRQRRETIISKEKFVTVALGPEKFAM